MTDDTGRDTGFSLSRETSKQPNEMKPKDWHIRSINSSFSAGRFRDWLGVVSRMVG